LGADFRGDPASALLEVLDPEQNREFRDHYLEVAFDLSQVLFITTANTMETIPGPLLDRMEVIPITSYTEHEKVTIARGYLVPRQIRENGLLPEEITFADEALYVLIRSYTREAGVRNLEREIGSVCRKVVTRIAEHKVERVAVTPELVSELLGKPHFYPNAEVRERTAVPGVATALAWTPVGGDLLFIEATRMPGKHGFQLTGSLGQVMQESARAALSYVRSKTSELGLAPDFFEHNDIHLHIPAGAQPKDGPSAGITMATALISLVAGRPVRSDLGMTGEITLRGQVLPIGGLKEKVLAAHRAGLKAVILPKRNMRDLDDIPEDVRTELTFIPVERMEEVVAAALTPPPAPAARKRRTTRAAGAARRPRPAKGRSHV
jgi:ATP-dependent Lon protease